jgi:hypothetical protein
MLKIYRHIPSVRDSVYTAAESHRTAIVAKSYSCRISKQCPVCVRAVTLQKRLRHLLMRLREKSLVQRKRREVTCSDAVGFISAVSDGLG